MRNLIQLTAVLLISGCAAHPEPIIDTKGVNMKLYEQDLEECTVYSQQINTGEGVVKGAAAGAAIGTATGAISGHPAEGAGYGAIAGSTKSARLNEREKQQVVKNCLRYRGYKVLN